MRLIYYCVYSTRSRFGTGVGRNVVTCDVPVNSMQRILAVEAELLKALKELEPDSAYSHLFLLDWKLINEDVAA